MTKRIYYIDPLGGDDANSGIFASQPLKTYDKLSLIPGDTVLFKRSSIIRGSLDTCDGSEDGDITYGAYGEGPRPVFLGSLPADGTESWVEEAPSIWRFNGTFSSEVCNLVFNGGEVCGNMRWQLSDLKVQGEWYFTLLGFGAETEHKSLFHKCEDGILYLYSSCNPARYYKSIECALWGNRRMAGGKCHIVLENLVFKNAGVHGFQEIQACHITILNCEFSFIGGAVWSRERRIRFGNAVEFWDGAQDITIENCIFNNIYDSGVTHQGSEQSDVPKRIHFRNNLFIDCGMAAYECRGPAAQEVYFENNTCINAGGGFSIQGEPPPRQSEIYPQPMGHHIFIWRIDRPAQMGYVYIRNNIFYEAPFGAALYSIINPEVERQLIIDNNCYFQTNGNLLNLMNGKLYKSDQFQLYQSETGHDKQSIFTDQLFIDAEAGIYLLQDNSPCPEVGMKK